MVVILKVDFKEMICLRLKKVKNAKETIEESKYVIKNPEENKGCWKKEFNNDNPINVEIGMGKGDFIIEMAKIFLI